MICKADASSIFAFIRNHHEPGNRGTAVITAVRGLREEDCKFKARPYLRAKTDKQNLMCTSNFASWVCIYIPHGRNTRLFVFWYFIDWLWILTAAVSLYLPCLDTKPPSLFLSTQRQCLLLLYWIPLLLSSSCAMYPSPQFWNPPINKLKAILLGHVPSLYA